MLQINSENWQKPHCCLTAAHNSLERCNTQNTHSTSNRVKLQNCTIAGVVPGYWLAISVLQSIWQQYSKKAPMTLSPLQVQVQTFLHWSLLRHCSKQDLKRGPSTYNWMLVRKDLHKGVKDFCIPIVYKSKWVGTFNKEMAVGVFSKNRVNINQCTNIDV